MALTELLAERRYDIAEDGTSALRVYRCLWSERLTVAGLPQMNDPYPETASASSPVGIVWETGEGDEGADPATEPLLLVRGIHHQYIAAKNPADDMSRVTVEWGTPRGQGADRPIEHLETASAKDTLREGTSGGGEIVEVQGMVSGADETFVVKPVKMYVPIDTYVVEKAYLHDYSDHYKKNYRGTVNKGDGDVGDRIACLGPEGTILLDTVEVVVDYKTFPQQPSDMGLDVVDRPPVTTMFFRHIFTFKQRKVPWNMVWINPTPALDEFGRPVVVGDRVGQRPDAYFREGMPAYLPYKRDPVSNAITGFDFHKIGWQELENKTLDPATGAEYVDKHVYPVKDWANIWAPWGSDEGGNGLFNYGFGGQEGESGTEGSAW